MDIKIARRLWLP